MVIPQPPPAARPEIPQGSLLKMSELSRRSGLSRQALNHYLLLGLIHEEARTPSNRCLFQAATLERLAAIEELKRTLTLQEIRERLGDAR